MQKLGETVDQLTTAAPSLKMTFSVLITAEGKDAVESTVKSLNDLLSKVTSKLRFE